MAKHLLPASDPVIIGATGGSGTRIVAAVLRQAGYFIGTNLNASNDAVEFFEFYDRWNDRAWNSVHEPLTDEEQAEREGDFRTRLLSHLRDLPSADSSWGWKNPRSIYQLDFFNGLFPQMKFIHVTRDGRDMAFSTNKNQLKCHGDAVLGREAREWSEPVRAAELWNRVNGRAHQVAQAKLANRYLLVRFEDLCSEPVATIRRIWSFAGAPADLDAVGAAQQVRPPKSLGRWRDQDPDLLQKISAATREGRELFGYLR